MRTGPGTNEVSPPGFGNAIGMSVKERFAHGVPYYSFPHMGGWPNLTQAVFGRRGGVSAAPYNSLNLSYAVGDDPASVAENGTRAAAAVGWELDRIVSPRQVHGRHVEVVGRGSASPVEVLEADALVTDEPGVLLLMKFADCVPIVLWDPVHAAVGLVHAGWKGTMLGAPAAALEVMAQRFGSVPSELLAGIGPSIGPCCYQVGPEVVRLAGEAFPGVELARPSGDGSAYLDLWKANGETLMRAGVPGDNLAVAGLCTRCRHDLFFSHRAAMGGPSGRFGVVAGLRDG